MANNRIIKAIGLVNTPKISMTGIIGTGHFNQVGTSGQKISFQYPLRPEKLTTTKVHTANTKVTDIFPARLAPPGKITIKPIKFIKRIKKNKVSKYGPKRRASFPKIGTINSSYNIPTPNSIIPFTRRGASYGFFLYHRTNGKTSQQSSKAHINKASTFLVTEKSQGR